MEETAPIPRGNLERTQPIPRVRKPDSASQPLGRPAIKVKLKQRYTGRSCLFFIALAGASLVILVLIGILGRALVAEWAVRQPRSNTLILGIDRRPEQGTVVRSDTMMILTAYPPDAKIGLLSIPRDLYVEIPGHGTSRINTAHFWGEAQAVGNGPALAMATVEHNFGVPIHHHMRVDFDGFRAVVDAVGGIDVVVEEPIVDATYPTEDYGTIRIEIPAGPQHMDGEMALWYARTRHGSSDFDRARRQQEIVTALTRRLLQPRTWPRLPAVYQAARTNIDTDMGVGDLLLLLAVLEETGAEGIEHQVIGPEMTEPWTTPSGGAVLLPRWELIHPLVEEFLSP